MVLGESVSGGMGRGAPLILASFAVLVRCSGGASRRQGHSPTAARRRLLNLGCLYGPASALGYALGYLLRKAGLQETPDPLLGAMVGAPVGALLFVVAGCFCGGNRRAVLATFQRPHPWLYATGVTSSAGQILYFAALNHSPCRRSRWWSRWRSYHRRSEPALSGEKLSPRVALAALLGIAGIVLLFGIGPWAT